MGKWSAYKLSELRDKLKWTLSSEWAGQQGQVSRAWCEVVVDWSKTKTCQTCQSSQSSKASWFYSKLQGKQRWNKAKLISGFSFLLKASKFGKHSLFSSKRISVFGHFFIVHHVSPMPDVTFVENLSNWSSGVQILRDICTRLGCYLYSTECSWIINLIIMMLITIVIQIIIIIIFNYYYYYHHHHHHYKSSPLYWELHLLNWSLFGNQ